MHEFEHIDDQMLGSFVDGELDASGAQLVLQAMDRDQDVRSRVHQLRRAKDMMKLGFGHAQIPSTVSHGSSQSFSRKYGLTLAASIAVLALSMGAGVVGYQMGTQVDSASRKISVSIPDMQSHRVILHISESNTVHFAKALEYAKTYIEKHQASGGKVAVVAHSSGIDLMRVGMMGYENRVRQMIDRYDNIHFIACANAIRALRNQGIEPRMVQHVDTSKPAMDQIIEHIQDGWDYIKVTNLVSEG
ncbi:MAG: hypothetical protein KZQ82_11555 [Candidatus Thiodiazotropha sp. (ex Lucinoma annulata)]|nr:hypothetical protein [Candidatus Thiodiazotropha sp. (ex Lucinoma annulata)]